MTPKAPRKPLDSPIQLNEIKDYSTPLRALASSDSNMMPSAFTSYREMIDIDYDPLQIKSLTDSTPINISSLALENLRHTEENHRLKCTLSETQKLKEENERLKYDLAEYKPDLNSKQDTTSPTPQLTGNQLLSKYCLTQVHMAQISLQNRKLEYISQCAKVLRKEKRS